MAHCSCDWCSAVRLNGAISIYDYECARFVPVDETQVASPRDYVLLEFKVDRDEECWPRPEPRATSAVRKTMKEVARRAIVTLANQLVLDSSGDVERNQRPGSEPAADEVSEEDKVDGNRPEPRADSRDYELELRAGPNLNVPRTLPFDSAVDLASYPALEWNDDPENYTTRRNTSEDDMED